MNWKANLQQAFEKVQRQQGRKKTRHTPWDALHLASGDSVFFVPRDTTNDHYGHRATVVRPARSDVQNPTVRLRFQDGTERTVQARLVRRDAPPTVEPAYLQEARKLPSWKRLVTQLQGVLGTLNLKQRSDEGDREYAWRRAEELKAKIPPEAEQRARQMAGMLKASIPEKERPVAAQVLLDAARLDAQAQDARQAQRGGRGPVRHEKPREAISTIDPARLDQEQRAMINLIAKSIHRRYFLSDRQIERGQLTLDDQATTLRRYDDPSSAVREELRPINPNERREIQTHLRRIIGLGQDETGSTDTPNKRGSKGNEVQGVLHDNLTAAYQKALEACQWLTAGRTDLAQTLAAQVQQHRLTAQAANAELERHRVKHHTGRYFHGDILSVRQEHIETDENGEFLAYEGMTQYYARVVFIYHADGHTLIVANATELESLTGMQVGPPGWASLCRWVQDMSDRAGGRKQGRRQDDDETLIYRDNEGILRQRDGLDQYPDLITALDCIRRALHLGMHTQGIHQTELPEHAPDEGFHAPTKSVRGGA